MNCTLINDMSEDVAKGLREVFGNNDTVFQIHVNDYKTPKFEKYLASKYPDKDPSVHQVVTALREYTNSIRPDINYSTQITDVDNPYKKFGYSSVADRELGKKLAAEMALDVYNQLARKMHKTPAEAAAEIRKKRGLKKYTIKDYFAEAISHKCQKEFVRVAMRLGHSQEEVLDAIKRKDTHTINKWFENATIQDKNVLALFKESKFNSNEARQKFMSEVFRDSRLGECRIDNDRELTDTSTYEAKDEAFNEFDEFSQDDTDTDLNDDKDDFITNANNHHGEYSTFMKHVDMSLRGYFGSLKKMHTSKDGNNKFDYNTDNAFGIPEAMSAEQCVAVFYSYGDFTNLVSMIESAKQIAKSVHGFAAFSKFAENMEKDEDFAMEVYRTFGKVIISKIETIVDGNNAESNITNKRSDKVTALNYEFLNNIRATAISTNAEFNLEKLKEIDPIITSVEKIYGNVERAASKEAKDIAQKELDKRTAELVDSLTNLIRFYFPGIDGYAISNFIKTNEIAGKANPAVNAKELKSILEKLIKETITCQNNYAKRETDLREIYAFNAKLRAAYNANEPVNLNDIKDTTAIFAKEYLSENTFKYVTQLANTLVKFTPVKVELNSRNVHGNQSSDVLNNSMITNVLKTLQSQLSLENYGKLKFQSRQYDLSNIMVEHKDENGKYINYGLFRKEGNEYVPTEYAHVLLRERLFAGASDAVSNKAVLYAEMSKGDYVATSFINFFNTPRDLVIEADTSNIPMAQYFMRIPSDAPKNFVITAPRYSTVGLSIIENAQEVNREVIQRINSISVLSQGQVQEFIVDDEKSMYQASYKQVINHLTSPHPFDVKLKNKNSLSNRKAKNGDTVYLTCRYKSEDGIENVYILEGKLSEKNGEIKVEDPKLLGVENNSFSADVTAGIRKRIMEALDREGKIKRKINTNHQIYKQLRQAFVQELIDMATFIDAIFETNDDGSIKTKLNKETGEYEYLFKPGFGNNPETVRQLHHIYHTDGKSIFNFDEKGIPHFTGKVFTSDRFTLHDDNFGKNILEEVFDFFSTGEGDNHIHFKKTPNGIEVEIQPNQEEVIERELSKFIEAYTNDAVIRMQQYREFIPEKQFTRENIEEFILNHHLTFIGFNDIFEGNTKFYKDNQTFLKRAKESQGSGVPYGILDYDADLTEPMKEISSGLDRANFQTIDANGNATPFTIRLRNKFKGVTIKNTIRTGKNIGEFVRDSKGKLVKDENGNYQFKTIGSLSQQLIDTLSDPKNGLTKEEATAKAANMMAGYADTTVNDAQSYITFEEWIRRITARGQLPKYKALIDAVLDESKPLDAETIGQFIQVQKNFYYDQHYYSKFGVIAPRQIKNAEFVLVPRLVRGTQLEEVYNMMKEAGVDQLNTEETSKAGKCNVLTIWDNDGKITAENKADFVANAPNASEEYSYNYLYTQQETPQHIDAENKAGIQIMKKIIDNIDSNSPLYPLKQKFFKLYSENIQNSFRDAMEEIGVKVDENGNIKLDENNNIEGLKFDKFFSMLRDEISRLGLDSNMMDYVTLAVQQVTNEATNGGKPITNMPTFLSAVSTKLESIAQSLFNNRITRQTLPGFHAAQITNVGFSPLNEQVSNRRYSKELEYHPDQYENKKTGEVISKRKWSSLSTTEQKDYKNIGPAPYVEIALPASNFGLRRYTEDGRRKTDEELLQELEDAGLDMMIGYRIPTEGKQSVCVMKVVAFTDDAYGSTIVVPDEWVAQTGSDFDIDSVYGIQFKGKYGKDGKLRKYEYREGDKESQAQRYGRNNELLQCMIDILSSSDSLEENLSQSNFRKIIEARDEAINKQVAINRKQRSCYNFFDQADYQEDVMSGAKLKAFSVTRDTFCSVCNTVKPVLSDKSIISVIYTEEDGYTLDELKKHFDDVENLGNGRFLVKHGTIGWSKDNKNVIGELITTYSSQTTAHILDAVKEGAIPNVNDYTFQVYKLFPDIGSDYHTGIPFIMQNGITRIVNAYNGNKSIYSFETSNPIHAAIKEVAVELLALDGKKLSEYATLDEVFDALQDYNKDLSNIFGATDDFKIKLSDIEIGKLPLDGNSYRRQLKSPSPIKKENLLFDLGVILQYYKLNKLGDKISSYARVCNPDKFGAKQSIFATNKVFDDIATLIEEEGIEPTLTIWKEIQHDKVPTVKGDGYRLEVSEEYTKEQKENPNFRAQPRFNTYAATNFLEALYPGLTIVNGAVDLDSFIKSENQESAYPPLYNFLKYASATSVKINRYLFETQNKSFIDTVNELRFAFSGARNQMTEKIYKDYQQYILNHLYKRTTAVKSNVTYKIGEGFVFTDKDLEQERRRIYGFGYNPNLNYIDADGNEHEFIVKDINNPTQEEIDNFASMTPAQKVMWIKANFRESGVFKYIDANLFNEYKYRRTKIGAQEISFAEGNVDIETVYNEFEKCFYNNNPLVALASLDIVKYGFMVDGFKMKRNAVYKVIKNSCLMDSESPLGTGIVQELNLMVKDLEFLDSESLMNDYVRSHSDMSQISSKRVPRVGKNKNFELPYRADFMIGLDLNNKDDRAKAIKFNLIYETGTDGEITNNKYVKLKYDKKVILYKINYNVNTNRLIAYPLNKLETNENSLWSANALNNIYPSEDYYKQVVNDIFNDVEEVNLDAKFQEVTDEEGVKHLIEMEKAKNSSIDALISKHQMSAEDKKKYRFHNDMTVNRQGYFIPFDINDKTSRDAGGFQAVIDAVEKHFGNFPLNQSLILRSGALSNYISQGSSIQTINGRDYQISRMNLNSQNNRYIGEKNKHKVVNEKNPQIQAIMEAAQAGNYRVNDAFMIRPVQNTEKQEVGKVNANIMDATVVEFETTAYRNMARSSGANGDVRAANSVRTLEDKDITPTIASVESNLGEIVPITAEYIQHSVNSILNDLDYFIKDSDDKWHSINDPETINLIRNNPAEKQRFLKTLLNARAFVTNYRLITELDIDSEDEVLRPALRKIKESINKLQNAVSIEKAEKEFALNYLSKLSTNPLIQGDVISMLDGFHSASAFDAWVNDVQESSSPLIQIITKEVMGDIRAKEMKAKKIVSEFRKQVAAIEKKAKDAGHPINWDHIIDEFGKFVQEYNQDFVDEIQRLRTAISDAKAGFDEGTIDGIEKYLRAKLEYDKFKLRNTNQPIIDEYYERRIQAQEHMLNEYKVIYCTYQKLAAEKREILTHLDPNGQLEESYKAKFEEVKQKLADLTSLYTYDPDTNTLSVKYNIDDPNNPFTGERKVLLSVESATALKKYLGEMSELYKDFFTQDAKFGFEEELEKHLDRVNFYEIKYGKDNLELEEHEDYVKSRDWLNYNTRYVVDDDLRTLVNTAFQQLRENTYGSRLTPKLISDLAHRLNAYDSYGVIDATKFSESQIDAIRREQEAKYGINEAQPFSDKALINCAPTDDTIFSDEFYKGMTTNGAKNQDYIKKVQEINDITKKYYDPVTKTIDTFEMSEDELRELDKLYDELEDIKKTKGATNKKAVRKFISEHVEFKYNEAEFERNKRLAYARGDKFGRLWQRVNERIEEDENGNDIVVPNRYLYSYAVPKGYKEDGSGDNTYVDKKKTEALRTIRKYTKTTRTKYYYQKFREMQALSKLEFNKWYYDNHIYNPHTHTMEPLPCWTTMEIGEVADDGEFVASGEYVPAYNQLQSRPLDGKDKNGKPNGTIDVTNPQYKQKAPTAANFKRTAEAKYHKPNLMTEEEHEMKDLFQSILRQNATTPSAQRFIDKGYMAARAKNPDVDAKFIAKEAAKMIGWISGNSGREAWYDHVDYAHDRDLAMPMMSILKSKDSIKVPDNPPVQNPGESDTDFNKRKTEYEENVAKAKAQNEQVHKDMLDRNWPKVMEEFITRAAHFNAVQDNKYMLFYAKNMIDKIDVYQKNLGFNSLKTDSDSLSGFATKKDTHLSGQFENWIRRLVYDQWKKPNNKFTRAANILQSLSSSKYMMLNVTGGIANVTVGEANIFGEILAQDYLGAKTWLKGKGMWMQGIPSFFRDMYSDRATSLPSAIVQFFNVVDFDEHNGVVNVPDAAEWSKRVRDAMFSPQAMGEHFMQNGVLFSMLYSNRLIKNDNKESNGKTSYIYCTEAQYMNKASNDALEAMLKDNAEFKAKYDAFKKKALESPDNAKEFAWFREDLATEFANAFMSYSEQKKFIKARRDAQKDYKIKFYKNPDLMSQLKLTEDGQLGFKEGSELFNLGDEAYDILGRFKGTVISVNKKIHGVYDKLGAARIESHWLGGIAMQYHKHIYPGLMKRYRRQGYYNEERGSIEKGCYASLKDFLALPLHKAKYVAKLKEDTGISEAELERTIGIQNILRNYVEFATHVRLAWNIIPEHERANIKRALGDFAGVLAALCLAIAMHCIYDDDDESLVYNLAIYEADRLASESFMYNPIGLYAEGKKLWSSPVAIQGTISDFLGTCGFIAKYMLQGDEFDPYYQSGLYAGEHKLTIKLKRNIPIYHSINMLTRLKRNNAYYKLTDNMLSIIPVKDIADFITD